MRVVAHATWCGFTHPLAHFIEDILLTANSSIFHFTCGGATEVNGLLTQSNMPKSHEDFFYVMDTFWRVSHEGSVASVGTCPFPCRLMSKGPLPSIPTLSSKFFSNASLTQPLRERFALQSSLKVSVLMLRLSYPTETVLSNKITRNRIVLSFKDSPRKPLGRRPCDTAN